jgi:hypothetical protein
VGDVERGVGYGKITYQTLHNRRVSKGERPQQKPGRNQCGLLSFGR